MSRLLRFRASNPNSAKVAYKLGAGLPRETHANGIYQVNILTLGCDEAMTSIVCFTKPTYSCSVFHFESSAENLHSCGKSVPILKQFLQALFVRTRNNDFEWALGRGLPQESWPHLMAKKNTFRLVLKREETGGC